MNPSIYAILHAEFESRVQIGPKPTQNPILTKIPKERNWNRKIRNRAESNRIALSESVPNRTEPSRPVPRDLRFARLLGGFSDPNRSEANRPEPTRPEPNRPEPTDPRALSSATGSQWWEQPNRSEPNWRHPASEGSISAAVTRDTGV